MAQAAAKRPDLAYRFFQVVGGNMGKLLQVFVGSLQLFGAPGYHPSSFSVMVRCS
jgi:hypothetical protein